MMRRSILLVGNHSKKELLVGPLCSPSTRPLASAGTTCCRFTTRDNDNNNNNYEYLHRSGHQTNARGYDWGHGAYPSSSLQLHQHQQQRLFSASSSTTQPPGYSERSSFQNLPVHTSILRYIEQTGVGRATPRKNFKRKKKRISNNNSRALAHQEHQQRQGQGRNGASSSSPSSSMVYSRREEEEHFRHETNSRVQRRREGGSSDPKNRPPPPPPFGFGAATTKITSGENEKDSIKIQRLPVKIIGSVGSQEEEFPRGTKGLPEVAIAGRSNVGKSTLLNALLYGNRPSYTVDSAESSTVPRAGNRRRMPSAPVKLPRGLKAVTSAKPGETRRLTFYQLSAKVNQPINSNFSPPSPTGSGSSSNKKLSLLLVDLPGYGFAYASQGQAEQWQSLMESYILRRGKSLKRVLLLLDARHGMKKSDIDFLESLQTSLYSKVGETGESEGDKDKSTTRKQPKQKPNLELPPIQLVLTKCDLVSQHDLARRVVLVRKQLSDCLRREPSSLPIMMVNAKVQGQGGVLELQKELAALVPNNK